MKFTDFFNMNKYKCDCGWIGTRQEMKNEQDIDYDQDCCPQCNDVLFDDFHGYVYAEQINISKFSDLKVGDTIKLLNNGEQFHIDKIFEDGHVDMTALKQYNPILGLDWNEQFYSIKLVNFEILYGNK